MKKRIFTIIMLLAMVHPSFAKVDKDSAEYLRDKNHFAIMNPFAEAVAQRVIRKSLKKELGENFKVKFEGYTLSSMKKGIFKYLEIKGKNVEIEGVEIPYLRLKTISDYNWVDYRENPPVFRSDMNLAYEIKLTEKSINQALNKKDYQKTLEKVNKRAYPLFTIHDVRVRIRHDKLHVIMDYNFPIAPARRNKTFMVSSDFKVLDNKIFAQNVGIDNSYGNLSVEKVTNLINLLDPLSYTLSIMNSKKCNTRVEKVQIIDNIVEVSGKIFIEGD